MGALLPNFDGVDDVLPENIAAWAYRRKRVQVGIGHPDGEGGVLLTERLSGLLCVVEVMADEAADGELHHAERRGHHGREARFPPLWREPEAQG